MSASIESRSSHWPTTKRAKKAARGDSNQRKDRKSHDPSKFPRGVPSTTNGERKEKGMRRMDERKAKGKRRKRRKGERKDDRESSELRAGERADKEN